MQDAVTCQKGETTGNEIMTIPKIFNRGDYVQIKA
jgi:hypothetical protein